MILGLRLNYLYFKSEVCIKNHPHLYDGSGMSALFSQNFFYTLQFWTTHRKTISHPFNFVWENPHLGFVTSDLPSDKKSAPPKASWRIDFSYPPNCVHRKRDIRKFCISKPHRLKCSDRAPIYYCFHL